MFLNEALQFYIIAIGFGLILGFLLFLLKRIFSM